MVAEHANVEAERREAVGRLAAYVAKHEQAVEAGQAGGGTAPDAATAELLAQNDSAAVLQVRHRHCFSLVLSLPFLAKPCICLWTAAAAVEGAPAAARDGGGGGDARPAAGKTLPLPCASTAFVTKTAPLPCASTAFVAKTAPFAFRFHCLRG